ncbi:MAG: response regulator [Bacteroidales bacterium]
MHEERILVVDDEIMIRTVLEKFLGRHFRVTAFDNGKEAMEWLQKGNYASLMIVDVQMPVMNGDEFLKQVRHSDKLHDIPIFMLSGHEEEKERKRLLALGADEYFVKPLHPGQLKDKIESYLKE